MMEENQDSTENKLDKVDSYLTKFGTILKKHWGKLLLILFGYCVYWAFTQPPVPEDNYPDQNSSYIDSSAYDIPQDSLPADSADYQSY